jgi:hypothetical protein
MTAALVTRPDLSQRTNLNKSALVTADLCGAKAWLEIHDRRPLIPQEQITFGSAVDAGVEVMLTMARAGLPIEEVRYMAAVEEVIARDETGVSSEEVGNALFMFGGAILPHFDFAFCRLQETLREDLDGLGEAEGHPDVILADGSIFDVKTAKRSKPEDAARTSVELGFYALLAEASGLTVPRVGYWTWVRTRNAAWQHLDAPVTDEMRRRTYELAAAYVRAKKADEVLNRKAATPLNFTFPSGPRNLSLCGTCQYNPTVGGPCRLAVQEGVSNGE